MTISLTPVSLVDQERAAYNAGNTELASLLDYAASALTKHDSEIDSIDDALDLLGLSGKRGDILYSATENISKQLDAIEELMIVLNSTKRLPKEVQEAIKNFKESHE